MITIQIALKDTAVMQYFESVVNLGLVILETEKKTGTQAAYKTTNALLIVVILTIACVQTSTANLKP